ncbi:hypothetical protein [Pseudomonas sp. Marseille-QA0892]
MSRGSEMQAERRAIGQRNEAERRAGGRAMEERRRGTKAVDDLNSLVEPPRRTTTLSPVAPVGGFPTSRGRGVWNESRAPRGGGGIASPLKEVTKDENGTQVPDREHWPNMIMTSSDGLFVFEVKPIKTWKFKDANGDAVQLQIAQPKKDEA